MRGINSDLILNDRHFKVHRINEYSAGEGWASYAVIDAHTNFAFCLMEYAGEKEVLDTAARKAEKLCKQNINGLPRIYDIIRESRSLFIVMEIVKGQTLRAYLTARKGPAQQDLSAMVEYARRICTILAQLQPAFVHRRLLPENIVMTGKRVALKDMGFLVMPAGFEREQLPYRAPEQLCRYNQIGIGCRTDIYTFGVIFGEMLTGWYAGPGTHASGEKNRCFPPAEPWEAIPGELKEIVVHCTQYQPVHRPGKIEEVERRLSQWLLFRRGELIQSFPGHKDDSRPEQHDDMDGFSIRLPRLKRILQKTGFLLPAAGCVVCVLVLLQSALTGKPADFAQTVKLADTLQTVVAKDAEEERRAALAHISARHQAAGVLLSAYSHAIVQSSPERTAQNFRDIQHKTTALLQDACAAGTYDHEARKVAALQIDMLELLESSAGIFADYIEGKRKITANVDWVDEANIRYRRSCEVYGQIGGELEKMKLQP